MMWQFLFSVGLWTIAFPGNWKCNPEESWSSISWEPRNRLRNSKLHFGCTAYIVYLPVLLTSITDVVLVQ